MIRQAFSANFASEARSCSGALRSIAAAVLIYFFAGPAALAGSLFDLAPYSELDQYGTGFPELGGFLPLSGGHNQATVTQDGSFNRLSAIQYGGYNNLDARQTGNYNIADLLQVGLYNSISLTQSGEANRAEILQGGLYNTAQVSQTGINNLALVLQLGVGMRVTVTQNGNNNVARVIQR
jgi:hypothetical protein